MPRISLIQIRKGTTAEWNSANPVLGSGEPGYDLDLNHLKVGDGSANWNSIQPIGSALHPNINASDSSDNNLDNHFVRNLLLDENGHVTGIYVTNLEQIELSTDPSPQLGGNLNLNNFNISGVGNLDFDGRILIDSIDTTQPLIELSNTHSVYSGPILEITQTNPLDSYGDNSKTDGILLNFDGFQHAFARYLDIKRRGTTVFGVFGAKISATDVDVVFNENAQDRDFQVKGNTDNNLLFVDGSEDRVGIGISSPQYKLDVFGSGNFHNINVENNIIALTGIYGTLDLELKDEASAPAHQEGRLFYDSENHALVVYNEESEVAQQLGQEEYLRVRNNTGATITNGTPVIITGSHGNIAPTIAPANAASDVNSRVVGLATHDIENNSFGYVTTYGIVRDIDTSSFSDGDEIFLSTTPGALTATCPVIPNYCAPIGYVIRSHAANGSILVELGKHKLGGGDLKSEANLNLQGIPFVSTVGSDRSGGLLTDANLVYNSGVQELNLGTGGIRFSDGTTQTTSAGGVNKDYVSVTSHYTLTTDNDVVFVNSSAALVNVYIPTANGVGGKEIIVKKTVGSNNVVINPVVGTETIDGNSSFTITSNYESVTLISDNTNWFII